jgi:hypothetical protein
MMGTPTPPMVDSNIGGLLLTLLWSLAGVSACILVLRLYIGAFILHRIKLPDYLMIIAFVSVTSILELRYAEAIFYIGLCYRANFIHHRFGSLGLGQTYNLSQWR